MKFRRHLAGRFGENSFLNARWSGQARSIDVMDELELMDLEVGKEARIHFPFLDDGFPFNARY